MYNIKEILSLQRCLKKRMAFELQEDLRFPREKVGVSEEKRREERS